MGSNAYYGVGHAIKAFKPHYMLVFDADGEQINRVNNPEIRARVQRVLNALDGLAWSKIEMYDKKDGLVNTYRRNAAVDDAPAQAVEELGASSLAADRELGRMANIATIMGNHQERALRLGLVEMRETFKPLLDGILKLHEIGWGKLSLYEKQYEHAATANARLTQQLQNARVALVKREAEGENDELEEVFNAVLPGLVQAATAGRRERERERDDDDDDGQDEKDEKPKRKGPKRADDRRSKIGRDLRPEHDAHANGTNGNNGKANGSAG